MAGHALAAAPACDNNVSLRGQPPEVKEMIMKRRVLLVPVLYGVFLSVACLWAESSGKKADTEKLRQREKVLAGVKKLWINSRPDDALLLRILVQGRNAQRGIEVGSAVGFGAINMGIGFERTGGHLYTIDIDPEMARKCRENVTKADLQKTITVIEGDALKVLPKLEGQFDFVFIDAHKQDYLKYFKALEAKLKPGAVVVGHNAIVYAKDMKDWLDYMKTSPDWEMVIVRAGSAGKDGMAVCYKIR